MGEVPATVTPLAPSETAPAFVDAWGEVLGGEPSRREAEWLLAFMWNENARGKAIVQHNWGNLSSSGKSGDFWRPPWFDLERVEQMSEPKRSMYRRIHERMLRGEEPSAFQAFPDHATGAAAWLRLLKRLKGGVILRAAKKNSGVAMQDAIFKSGYCASPACATNAASYRSLRNDIRAQGLFAGLRSSSSGGGGGGFVVLFGAAALLGGLYAWTARKTK